MEYKNPDFGDANGHKYVNTAFENSINMFISSHNVEYLEECLNDEEFFIDKDILEEIIKILLNLDNEAFSIRNICILTIIFKRLKNYATLLDGARIISCIFEYERSQKDSNIDNVVHILDCLSYSFKFFGTSLGDYNPGKQAQDFLWKIGKESYKYPQLSICRFIHHISVYCNIGEYRNEISGLMLLFFQSFDNEKMFKYVIQVLDLLSKDEYWLKEILSEGYIDIIIVYLQGKSEKLNPHSLDLLLNVLRKKEEPYIPYIRSLSLKLSTLIHSIIELLDSTDEELVKSAICVLNELISLGYIHIDDECLYKILLKLLSLEMVSVSISTVSLFLVSRLTSILPSSCFDENIVNSILFRASLMLDSDVIEAYSHITSLVEIFLKYQYNESVNTFLQDSNLLSNFDGIEQEKSLLYDIVLNRQID